MFSKVLTIDDVCIENLKYFKYIDNLKEQYPQLKVIAFTIASWKGEGVGSSQIFFDWYQARADWVEIGIHGYDHELPQEGWREDQEVWISLAGQELKSYLPSRPLYRPPGFRFLPCTEHILRKLGVKGIGHQGFIKYFDTGEIVETFDTHCSDKYVNPITKLKIKYEKNQYNFTCS